MKILAILLFLSASLCSAAELKSGGIVLLQPDEDLRTKGIELEGLVGYLRAAESAATSQIKNETLKPTAGFIVFAVREGKLSNAWVDFNPALPAKTEARLIASARAIPAFPVSHGTVVFALKVTINGAPERAEPTPLPAAWRSVMAKQDKALDVESLVMLVWP